MPVHIFCPLLCMCEKELHFVFAIFILSARFLNTRYYKPQISSIVSECTDSLFIFSKGLQWNAGWWATPFLPCPLGQDVTSAHVMCEVKCQEMHCSWMAGCRTLFFGVSSYRLCKYTCALHLLTLAVQSCERLVFVGWGRKQTVPNIWKHSTNGSHVGHVCKYSVLFLPLMKAV